jgi:ribulose-bisphosphate carboxylase large chain
MSAQRILVTYRLHVPAAEAGRRARALAVEQSIEMPPEAVMDRRVMDEVEARVEQVEVQADGTTVARIALSAETVGDDAGQLMNMLFGNSSLQPDVELVDVEVPGWLAAMFGGPASGIEGLRRLAGVPDRPLTCTALKPIGSSVKHLAALCGAFAQAGVDVIKDDHGWADQVAAPFAQRVAACQRAVDATNATRSGASTVYAPSLFGTHTQMQRQVELARSHGIRLLLIAPMVCGVATFNALRREHPDLAFLAHPALGGNARIAPAALLGRLFRLFGADAVIFPNHGGRFAYPRADCQAIAAASRAPWHALRPSLPTPAGGMSVERCPEIIAEYGRDTMLLIGGSLLSAREKIGARTRAFVEAVRAEAAQVSV